MKVNRKPSINIYSKSKNSPRKFESYAVKYEIPSAFDTTLLLRFSYLGIDVSIISCERKPSPKKTPKKSARSKKCKVCAVVGCIVNDGNASSRNIYGTMLSIPLDICHVT